MRCFQNSITHKQYEEIIIYTIKMKNSSLLATYYTGLRVEEVNWIILG